MARITPIENGLHSLAKGLEAFDVFHNDNTDAYALKDAILRTHQSLETISKAILFQLNPVLVLKGDTKVNNFIKGVEEYLEGKNSFIIDQEDTIGLLDALKRLRGIGILESFPDREYFQLQNAVEQLISLRNFIQHFAMEANVDVVARILGNVIPRFIDLLEILSASAGHVLGNRNSAAPFKFTAFDLQEYGRKLNDIYPKSLEVIDLLRSRYDQLIRNAIEFFSEREFPDAELRLKVNSHGNVGAPPYNPDITITGALDLTLSRSQLYFLDFPPEMRDRFSSDKKQSQITSYEGSVNILNPTVINNDQAPISVVTGKIELNANVSLKQIESVVFLPDSEDHLPIFRDAEIRILASMDYEAEAFYNQAHYDIQSILTATGKFILDITAVPFGYDPKSDKSQISGRLQCDLDKNNAPFRLHAFVDPDRTLRDNHSLDWIINAKSVFKFLKF